MGPRPESLRERILRLDALERPRYRVFCCSMCLAIMLLPADGGPCICGLYLLYEVR